jgi:hypothetical protein
MRKECLGQDSTTAANGCERRKDGDEGGGDGKQQQQKAPGTRAR